MLTKWLIRLFIRHPEQTADADVRYRYGRLAGFTGIACNLLLFGGKLLAGLLSGSVAIIADAFNNLSDAGSVIVTLVGFKLANIPADSDHPFGHGRFEYLSAMGVAVLIILAGFELAGSALDKILHPVAADFRWLTVFILAASILVKLWMAAFYRCIGRRISSEALIASAADSRNDVICSAVVLLSALVGWRTGLAIDGWIGMAVALFVMWSGFSIIRDAISPLLGKVPDPALVEGIVETVMAREGIVGIHDLMVHDYGPGRVIVSLHAEVPASRNVLESHEVIDEIEQELMRKYRIISCIHMDPVDTDDPETLALRDLAWDTLTALDPRLTLHDFRVVKGKNQTNLLFDVVTPFGYAAADTATLPQRLQQAISRTDPRLHTIIHVENSYT